MNLGFKRKFHKENYFHYANQFLLDLLIVKSPIKLFLQTLSPTVCFVIGNKDVI